VNQDQGRIVALCLSKDKHVAKKSKEKVFLKKDFGIVGDAHGGSEKRQVSLLSKISIEKMKEDGADVTHGAFAENMIVEGIDFKNIFVGSRLRIGRTGLIEVTQIGKKCHNPCSIYDAVGYCIMPKEGVFAKVLESGEVEVFDSICFA